MKTQALVFVLASASVLTVSAEQYRLKIAASVDVIEDGKVVGQKRLKAGTVVEVAEAEEAAKADEAAKTSAGGSLRPSNLSPIVFKNTKPAIGHIFNAEVSLSNRYYGPFDGKDALYWSVTLYAYNEKWGAREGFQAYAKKADAIGKKVFALLKDGDEKAVRVKISIVKNPDHDDLVNIEAIEATVRPD